MKLTRVILILSAIHFLAVVLLFLCFGLGLEGKESFGHGVLWGLLLPGLLIPGHWFIVIPLNSILWGFCGAMILKGLRSVHTGSHRM